MTGGNITAGPSSVGAIAGGTSRAGRGPELDLDDDRSLGERLFQWALILLWLAVAASALGYGLPYYRLSLSARADSPLDELLRPSGLIGQGYGVVGTFLIMVGVGMYSFRKRIPFLRRL